MNQRSANSYDLIPYNLGPFQNSHPDRLATIGRLFGIEAPPVRSCRVLELGCASGGNLIPAAFVLPDATFVGLDLSQTQIFQGKSAIQKLGLKNIDLIASDINDINSEIGKFDYIIVHGLFSWVENDLQKKIFQICSDFLNENGIAYISFNTYPGWHFRLLMRELMLYHAGHIEAPDERVKQARAILDFVCQSNIQNNDAFGKMLKEEQAYINESSDFYLLHEYLEDENNPMYFFRFAEMAQQHDLQYLGDADFYLMLTSSFSSTIQETIARISNNIIGTEQYIDFLRNRNFRRTLLCKSTQTINRTIDKNTILQFLFSSPLRPQNIDLRSQSNRLEPLLRPNGTDSGTTTIGGSFNRAMFLVLSEIWPKSLDFDELLNAIRSRLSTADPSHQKELTEDADALGNTLLQAYAANAVVFRTEHAPFVTELSTHPQASELARLQAATQDTVATLLHGQFPLNALSKNLLLLMDGKRSQSEILAELITQVQMGKIVMHSDGKRITEQREIAMNLEEQMQGYLLEMARAALLVG